MNLKRFKAVLARIEKHPEWWDQTEFCTEDKKKKWDCGTGCCLAGHAHFIAKKNRFKGVVSLYDAWQSPSAAISQTATKYLDLSIEEKHYLFFYNRTLQDFRVVAETGRIPS